ncbi:MAG: toprim domain-containing protein [Alphaproteobacteria bacterium]
MPVSFESAMAGAGLACKDVLIPDGALHRFHVQGDRQCSKNGWYVLFSGDVASGIFGSWKTGEKHIWCERNTRELSPAQKQQHQKRIAKARQTRAEAERLRHKAARNKAQAIWKTTPSAPDNHGYLLKKHVSCHGLRLHKGLLVIPMHDTAGCLHSLQFIDSEGNKRFLSGGRKKSCHFLIGTPSKTLCIAEGYATAATIYETTGYAAAVAFDAGNLLSVAQALRLKHPHIKLIVCADNDNNTKGNPGLTKARQAAMSVGAVLAVPPCSGDFNDLYVQDRL